MDRNELQNEVSQMNTRGHGIGYMLILVTSICIKLHSGWPRNICALVCEVSCRVLIALVDCQKLNNFRATYSSFWSGCYPTSGGSSFVITVDGLRTHSAVHLRLLYSCCKTLRHILGAICHLCGPSYVQVIRDNCVCWLVDFQKRILNFADLCTRNLFMCK